MSAAKREKTGAGSSISINGADKDVAEAMKAQAKALKEQGQKTTAMKQLEALYQDPAAEKGRFYGYTITHTDDGKITVKSPTGTESTVPEDEDEAGAKVKVTRFIFDLRTEAQGMVFVPGNGHRAVRTEHVEQVKERVNKKKTTPAAPAPARGKKRSAPATAAAASMAPALRRSSRRGPQ